MIFPCPKPLPQAPEKKERARPQRDRALEAWALAVKARSGHSCEMAGVQHRCSAILEAHHIFFRSTHPKLRLDPENGLALCHVAHDLVHRARWFRPHFRAWFDAHFPGRRERLQAKAIAQRALP